MARRQFPGGELAGTVCRVGTMANANKAIKGATLGSVPIPVRIPPKAIPVTQYRPCNATPVARKGVGRRLRSGPAAMANEAIASSQGNAEPLCGNALAREVSKWAYHDGWPFEAESRVELIDPPARLAGRSHNTAESVQNVHQAMSGATLPNGPDAAAEDGIPAATSSAPESVCTSLGQTSIPIKG